MKGDSVLMLILLQDKYVNSCLCALFLILGIPIKCALHSLGSSWEPAGQLAKAHTRALYLAYFGRSLEEQVAVYFLTDIFQRHYERGRSFERR